MARSVKKQDAQGRWRDANGRFTNPPRKQRRGSVKRPRPAPRRQLRYRGRFTTLETLQVLREADLLTPRERKQLERLETRQAAKSLERARKTLVRDLKAQGATRVRSKVVRRPQREFGVFTYHIEITMDPLSQQRLGRALSRHVDRDLDAGVSIAQTRFRYAGLDGGNDNGPWRTMGASDNYSASLDSARETTGFRHVRDWDGGEFDVYDEEQSRYGNAYVNSILVSVR